MGSETPAAEYLAHQERIARTKLLALGAGLEGADDAVADVRAQQDLDGDGTGSFEVYDCQEEGKLAAFLFGYPDGRLVVNLPGSNPFSVGEVF
jgi:hypothetical protein